MNVLPWYRISRHRLESERTLLRSLRYFIPERQYFDTLKRLNVVGILIYSRMRSGRVERFRVRIEYPARFPNFPQQVYDHDKVFQPGHEGHLPDHRLCLTLPERREFSTGTEGLTEEVLGASLIWLDKRLIFERNGGKWPGLDERHGLFAKIDFILEATGLSEDGRARSWMEDTLAAAAARRGFDIELYSPCPCGSGEKMKFCHFDGFRPLIKLLREVSRQANG